MSLGAKYNLKSPGVKRLMREAMELANPTEEYYACPLEDNLFEWHFTVRGPPGTEFEGGCYHGRILLPSQYPMQPPNIILLTPNGRFEVNKKICLSISGHHPESWQPSWSIRTALLALIAFMPTPAGGTIGSLDYPPEERRALAGRSARWECATCGGRAGGALAGQGGAAPAPDGDEARLLRRVQLKAEEDTNRTEPRAELKEEDNNSPTQRNEENNEIRQRVIPSPNDTELNLNTADSLLQGSVERTNRDKKWAVVIWLLLSIITLLLIRRLFFL